MVYRPTRRKSNPKSPAASVCFVVTAPVDSFESVTVAPTTTPPVESFTVP
jgi:hypothetical protein